MAVDNFQRPTVLPPERGLGSVVEFNGLRLHDRKKIVNGETIDIPDVYRIKSISGLGTPDIRDVREERPAEHGEIARNSYYGGRTIVISGVIQAGNIPQIRQMADDLRGAFGGGPIDATALAARLSWARKHEGSSS